MNTNIKNSVLNSNINKNKPVVLALSGGVDSMVLFDVLHELEYDIIIAHVNHNKRSESIDEYNHIQKMAYRLKIPFEGLVLHQNIEGNFQEKARYLRYAFFADVCNDYNTEQIVVAHHADDQIETVLMRLTRGSSFNGYAGIQAETHVHGFTVLRPLLFVTKEEIISYAMQKQLIFFEDTSNQEDTYTRNRFRNHIIPLLKKESPQLHQKIEQFCEYIDMANQHIDKTVHAFIEKHQFDDKVDINAFSLLDKIIQFKVIQKVVNEASNDTVEVLYTQYLDILNIISNNNPNVVYNLSKGFEFIKEYQYFYIQEHQTKERVSLEIKDVGEYSVNKDLRYVFSHEKLDIKHSNSYKVWYNKDIFPLYLRHKENGDKMNLKIGTKKVKDILIDQKVPAVKRENLILLANNDTVLWIPRIKRSIQNEELPNILYIYEVR